KKITILLCFLSLLAFISCNNEGSTGSEVGGGSGAEAGGGSGTGSETSGSGSGSGSGGQTASSSYVGTWLDSKDNKEIMTINSDGSITIDGIGKVTNITKKSDTNFVMQYDETQHGVSVTIIYDIKFSNSNSGTIDVTTIASEKTTPSGTINIVKK
ncbi:hypothetical protein, partial [Brachyspira catarrhinii]